MTWQWAPCSSFPNHFLQSQMPPVTLLPKAGAGQALGEFLSNPPLWDPPDRAQTTDHCSEPMILAVLPHFQFSPWALGSLGAKGKVLVGCKLGCQETATEAPSHRSHLEVTKSKLNFRVQKDEQQQKVPQGVTDPTSKQQNAKQTSSPEKPASINNSLMIKKPKKQNRNHLLHQTVRNGREKHQQQSQQHPNKLPKPRTMTPPSPTCWKDPQQQCSLLNSYPEKKIKKNKIKTEAKQ